MSTRKIKGLLQQFTLYLLSSINMLIHVYISFLCGGKKIREKKEKIITNEIAVLERIAILLFSNIV